MEKTLHGIVRGNTIELAENLGLAEGAQVELSVRVVPPKQNWGDGLRRCAGALAAEWTDEDDRILEAIYQERKLDTRREIPNHIAGRPDEIPLSNAQKQDLQRRLVVYETDAKMGSSWEAVKARLQGPP